MTSIFHKEATGKHTQYLNKYLDQLINLKHFSQYLNNYLGQLILNL